MKIWEKGINTEQKIEQFTVGDDLQYDSILAKYDIQASIAHAKMLATVGLITDAESASLVEELEATGTEMEANNWVIDPQYEDIHSMLEGLLIERIGDIGKKIHTARSRNDQVLVALHLYVKDEIDAIKESAKELFDLLMRKADAHKGALMPGYTHLQVAMPSSFGLWFSAYAETLVDDIHMLNAAYRVADQNPLGSAAGYGSSFPIDRQMTTDNLQFSTMKYNVVAAQMSRGRLEKTMGFAMASIASTMGKMAMDICLYMSQNFGFISFPDELTTGSSIMPHKKNPDVFELIRAKCSKVQSSPIQIAMLLQNLPSGYQRDLQLLKEILFPAIQDMKSSMEIMTYSLERIQVKSNILEQELYDHIFTVDTLNKWVSSGMPFRDAYQQMAAQIADDTYKPDRDIDHQHQGSIGNLCLDEIVAKMENALLN